MKPTLKWRYYSLKCRILHQINTYLSKFQTKLFYYELDSRVLRTINRNEQQIKEEAAIVSKWIKEINSIK